eukprot:5466508-Pleurochrysis_carterae.AAC.5
MAGRFSAAKRTRRASGTRSCHTQRIQVTPTTPPHPSPLYPRRVTEKVVHEPHVATRLALVVDAEAVIKVKLVLTLACQKTTQQDTTANMRSLRALVTLAVELPHKVAEGRRVKFPLVEMVPTEKNKGIEQISCLHVDMRWVGKNGKRRLSRVASRLQ